MTSRSLAALAAFALLTASPRSIAQAPTFAIDQVYSNADGSVQFVVLRNVQGVASDGRLTGRSLTATSGGTTKTYTFPRDLPSPVVPDANVLLGSVGFQALGLIATDYTIPDRFVPVVNGTLILADTSLFGYDALPADGVLALHAGGPSPSGVSPRPNLATNFAGRTASATALPITVVEFYNATLDHYFVSPLAPDIDALDTGRFGGWARTGRTFAAWPTAAAGGPGASPVCRFYIPPQKGDSHFFAASPNECADVLRNIVTNPNYEGVAYETPSAFHIGLPDAVTGACLAGTVPVYRLWNGRADSNHRYTIDRAVRDEMVAKGWQPEGYGPDPVAMCAPFAGSDTVVKVTDASPFPPNCSSPTGTLYSGAEVEPHVAINPLDANHLIGVWQQDRWSNGGARGNGTGVSFDGGRTWSRSAVPFTVCAGGSAGNGGDWDRASDPWVSFAPDGTAHQVALVLTGTSFSAGSRNGIAVSRSTDGGRTWSNPRTVISDGQDFFNDKEAIAADPTDARYVYVTWDRLQRTGGGPSWLARSVDGGASWDAARPIFDPGTSAQTLNNIPVVLPDGTLVNFFTRIDGGPSGNVSTLQLIRSADKGATWSAPVTIAALQSVGVTDPELGTNVRDARLLGSIAAGRDGELAIVWQDARFSNGARDAVALSRSFDGGLSWSTPTRVNRDPLVPAFIPIVAIRDDGTIGVTYYDFRSNTQDAGELATDVWLAQSADGITWRESRVAGPFDYGIAPNANGLFIGDYMGLVTRGAEFLPFFAVANNGTAGNRSDVAFASITSPGTPAPAGATGAKVGALPDDDAAAYRTEARGAMEATPALAARFDAGIRWAMQQRVPGWTSPSQPAGASLTP
jgi:hypothetical protein